MNTILLSFLFLCGFLHVQTLPVEENGQYYEAGNANAFIDSVLTAVKTEYGAQLEPFHLPNEELAFSQKVGIITLKGDIKLTNGTLNGLSHLHRANNATLGTENQHFVVHLQVGDENVKFRYNAHVDFLDILHPNLVIEGDIGNIDINATIMLDSEGKPVINQFEIDELKHVQIYIHGLGILDPLLDLIADAAIEVANPQIRNALSHLVQGMIGEQLANFHLPGTF